MARGQVNRVRSPLSRRLRQIVGGRARCRATAVGEAAWIQGLQRQARRFNLAHSELRAGIDRILRVVGWALLPTATLLFVTRFALGLPAGAALSYGAAGLVAMVPQGLVLLTSLALAVVRRAALSSARKWSGGVLEGLGTWLLGAPDVLLAKRGSVDSPHPVLAQTAQWASDGFRVLLLARAAGEPDVSHPPMEVRPVALILLSEQIRADRAPRHWRSALQDVFQGLARLPGAAESVLDVLPDQLTHHLGRRLVLQGAEMLEHRLLLRIDQNGEAGCALFHLDANGITIYAHLMRIKHSCKPPWITSPCCPRRCA